MVEKTNIFLFVVLIGLLLIIFYLPSLNQPPQPTLKGNYVKEEITRFQETAKKFVQSMGNMEKRLQTLEENVKNIQKTQETLEDSVKNIQKAQESLLGNKEKDTNIHVPEQNVVKQPVQRDTNLDKEHQARGSIHNFVGEIKRNGFCFDSAEHSVGGTIEIWQCHKQGRNQQFKWYENTIRHKVWCLAVEKPEEGKPVILRDCNDNQSSLEWLYQDRLLKAGKSKFCAMNAADSDEVTLALCNPEDKSQQWQLERT